MHGRRPSSDRPRSNSPGISAGRIRTENTWGFYNYGHKESSRDFGRFPARPFPPPPPPPPPPLPNRRSDVLMEAGRLAAEYLISQGLLPANLIPGKSALGDFEPPELRAWDQKEFSPIHTDGRISALARLGDALPDTGVPVRDDEVWPRRLGNPEPPFYVRRRFTAVEDRSGFRGRQKRKPGGSYRGYGSDWGRENDRQHRAPPFSDMPESEEDIPDYQIDNKPADVDADEAPQFAKPVSSGEIVSFWDDKPASMDADDVQQLPEPAAPIETVGFSDNKRADMDLDDAGQFSDSVPTSETANLTYNKRVDMDADQAPQFIEPAGTGENATFSHSHVETCNPVASNNVSMEVVSLGGGKAHSSVSDDTMVEAEHAPPALDKKDDNAVLNSDVVNDDKHVTDSDVNGKEIDSKYEPAQVCKSEDSSTSNHLNDLRNGLVRFFNFTKVPTKTRSVRQRPWQFQTDLLSVSSLISNSENNIPNGTICDAEAVDPASQNSMDTCLNKPQLLEDPLSGITKSEVPETASTEDTHKTQEVDLGIDVDEERGDNVLASPSSAQEELVKHSPEFTKLKDEVISEDSDGSRRVSIMGGGSDEFVQNEVLGHKSSMDWISPRNSQPDVYLLSHGDGVHASTSNDGHFSKNEEIIEADGSSSKLDSATTMMVEGPELENSSHPILSDGDNLHDNETQLLPCSFPMFDVNLSSEFDDVIQNHVASQYSLTEVGEEASRRVGLLMKDISNGDQGRVDPSNDFFVGPPGNDTWTGYDINTIEAGVFRTALVELFNKMPLVRKLYHNKTTLTKLKCLVCCGSIREMQTTYSSLEDLLDHTRNSDYLPKVHRGYGSAITDLLEMDLLNNSSSSVAISDLHSDVYLGFDEVLPGYDDQIYLSLDEISVDLPEV